ncbi:MAG: valine--tRNA ligase [Nitrospinae bacterium]|nr:valine--tRNA ligase [Nitrospinota bacterium]
MSIIDSKRYSPSDLEERLYAFWLENTFFHADEESSFPPYSIVIPPPNVTGSLHIGHALNNTLQDILCRWKRKKGFEVLWMPGTDHAGIATQNVVEKQLMTQGIKRQEVGREEFINKVWKWKEESGNTIIGQLKRIGASCDWKRERFTMDEGLSKSVRKVFVQLYNDGLIYKGEYLISWCPRCHTALSDLEVDHEEIDGNLYYIKYPVEDGSELIVATTRPETIPGDTAIAVNPKDPEKSKLIGKHVLLPLFEKKIKIIGDEHVDMDFGTGVLKVTPAHDPNDFEIGQRHKLESVSVMDLDGKMNEHSAQYKGMDRFECKKALIKDLEEAGLLVKVEKRPHAVGHCYRCSTIIEPLMSEQWYVKTKPLAEKAIEVVEKDEIMFYPASRKKLYFEWMRNINDWCISRQIWWGHRIPAWLCDDCGKFSVAENDPDSCEHCGSNNIEQETDVLDTWFSSALWPFSTMGWPEETKTLEKFYPTSVLVTAFDILFFWVARMIMMGLYIRKQIPFKEVYIHALVLDEKGKKMSKSKGNVIDPLLIIDEYGADAMRFTLAALTVQGRDIKLSKERIEGFRNFCNKLWNASRFVFMNIGDNKTIATKEEIKKLNLGIEDKWILSHLQNVTSEINNNLAEYKFSDAAMSVYHFFWHSFCDWYIELIKENLAQDKNHPSVEVVKYVLNESLGLLHPFMPYLTEEIWQQFDQKGEKSIMCTAFPERDEELFFGEIQKEMDTSIEIISKTRTVRGENNVSPKKELKMWLIVTDEEKRSQLERQTDVVQKFCKATELSLYKEQKELPEGVTSTSYTAAGTFYDIFIEKDEGSKESEILRLQKEKAKIEKEIEFLSKKLSNKSFVDKAPQSVVDKTQRSLEEQQTLLKKVSSYLEQ